MNGLETTVKEVWQPLAWLGLTQPFFTIGPDEIHVIIQTWIILVLLFVLCLPVRWLLKKKYGIARYLIVAGAENFIGLCEQSMGSLIFQHFAFITSLFVFILLCNVISIIPWMEEPTQNLNTTLALGISSFCYVQYHGIKAHGIKGYLKEFTEPFFVMAPLHIIGKIASIISMSFRLFGNIFGGAIIMNLYMALIKRHVLFELIGLGTGLNFIILAFFGLFEGFLQAFVFTMLSLTYLSIAIAPEETNHGEAS